jgi:hypothetical protein
MNIDELLDNKKDKKKESLGYDLMDDLMFFMNNDPQFYRKRYYPTMLKFDRYCKDGKQVSPRAFEGLVREAYESYRNKFQQVEGLEPKLDGEICEKLCRQIHEQETKNCDEGMYDVSN